jgi:predicted hotdog family 3-hydroxylacyl-ACP dehydratase|tara:strand:+ start:8614 stop:9072 length:459 start_codon:yes stop_codon:yes gene_type:complete
MSQTLPQIESLIRHRGRMLLIDRLLEASATHAVGEVTINEQSSFFRKGCGVPAYVGLEYMAQTVAAFDGALRNISGEEPAIGFLLGSRRYEATQSYFPAGATLTIHVDMVFSEGGMASFECLIKQGDETIVTAPLNVYRPESGEFTLPEGVT